MLCLAALINTICMACYKTQNGNGNETKWNGANEIRICNYTANPLFFCPREFRLDCKQRENRYIALQILLATCMINSSTFQHSYTENSVLATDSMCS